jgi:hypothetical protein
MRIVGKPRNGLLHGNRRVEGDGSAETDAFACGRSTRQELRVDNHRPSPMIDYVRAGVGEGSTGKKYTLSIF